MGLPWLAQKAIILTSLPSSLIAASNVPPVAIRSSMTKARSPGSTAPTCISILSFPYSNEYSSDITSPVSITKTWPFNN